MHCGPDLQLCYYEFSKPIQALKCPNFSEVRSCSPFSRFISSFAVITVKDPCCRENYTTRLVRQAATLPRQTFELQVSPTIDELLTVHSSHFPLWQATQGKVWGRDLETFFSSFWQSSIFVHSRRRPCQQTSGSESIFLKAPLTSA
ncbi:hypothetical protein VTI74DRAFT_539 [Chaetomium olivicolor]